MGRTGRIASWIGCAAIAAALLATGVAAGKADPAAKCHAAKTKLIGKFAQCLQKAAARRILNGKGTPICNPQRFFERWDAIEERADGACASGPGNVRAIADTLAWSDQIALYVDPPTRIVLYDAGPSPDGGFLGIPQPGHPGCAAALDGSFSCVAVAPFVSLEEKRLYSALEEIAPFPVPVVSRSGVQIADDVDALLDGDFDACLQTTPGPDCTVAAGVLPDDTLFWHGASLDGSAATSDNCSDFTDGVTGVRVANVGLSSADGQDGHASPWDGLVAACDGSDLPAPTHLVCACAQR